MLVYHLTINNKIYNKDIIVIILIKQMSLNVFIYFENNDTFSTNCIVILKS